MQLGTLPGETIGAVVESREYRRELRRPRAVEQFGKRANAALDAFDLLELAWHDCYGESTPPAGVTEDIWLVADGDIATLISACTMAVVDSRDLRLWADAIRESR